MAHAAPPDPALTIFWDNRHEGRGLSLKHQDRLLCAYIKLPLTAPTLTVNTGCYSHLTKPQHQSQVRLMYGISVLALGTCYLYQQRLPNPMCVASHVHIPVHTPVALAPPLQQPNAMHRQVTCTHPVVSLMTYTGDYID